MLAGQDDPRSTKLARCRAIFHKKPPANRKEKRAARSWPAIVKELTGRDPTQCPVCHMGTLIVVAVLPRRFGFPIPLPAIR
jgi:hypothetical protein